MEALNEKSRGQDGLRVGVAVGGEGVCVCVCGGGGGGGGGGLRRERKEGGRFCHDVVLFLTFDRIHLDALCGPMSGPVC